MEDKSDQTHLLSSRNTDLTNLKKFMIILSFIKYHKLFKHY